MKRYVRLSIFAEGHYSGATHEENLFITTELYEKVKGTMDTDFYIYELDGKHSCCEADFEVEYYDEDEVIHECTSQDLHCDGDDLICALKDAMDTLGLGNYQEVDDMLDKIDGEILALIDKKPLAEVKARIKKVDMDKFVEFVNSIEGVLL